MMRVVGIAQYLNRAPLARGASLPGLLAMTTRRYDP
jgi:hypothetical protein